MLSADLFNAVHAAYGDLDLGDDWEKYNYIEIQANNLTDVAIRNAIATAGTTNKDDIIVVHTTEEQNKILLQRDWQINELTININADQFGSVTIVSLGDKPLTFDATGQSRVFNIASISNVTLAGLTITGGNMWEKGGGINNAGSLIVTNCTISGNTAYYDGGGIYNAGSLTVINSTISGNTADYTGGGNYGGGGICNDAGTTTITNCTISKNTAYSGGSFRNVADGTMIVTNSTISGNTAVFGGGIFNEFSTLTLINSVIGGNTANGNAAVGPGGGGGICQRSGTSSITNCTIAGNVVDRDGGGIYHFSGDLIINNSIVVHNTFLSATGLGNDIYKAPSFGTMTSGSISGGYNLIGIIDGPLTLSDTVVGDPKFVAIPAIIDATTTGENYNPDNWDLRLQSGSAAINAGHNSLAVDAQGQPLTSDLDGNPRIFAGTVDLGAYECCVLGTAPTLYSVESHTRSLEAYWDDMRSAGGYLVQYATVADFSIGVGSVIAIANVKGIFELDPNTVYYVRVALCDSSGNITSDWSNVLTATTLPEELPDRPTNVKAINVSTTSVTLFWTGVPEAVGYEVQYSWDGGKTWGSRTTSGDTTVSVDELVAGMYYMFRVRAVMSEGGKSDWSDVLVCKTGAAENIVAAAKPKKVAVAKGAEKPTINALTLNITKNTKLAESGNTASYIVSCTSNPMQKFSYTVMGDKIFIEGLQPGTKYTFAVQAIHTNGNVSAVVSVKATTVKYTAIKSLKKTVTTADSVTLSWKPSTAPAQTTGYVIEVYDATGKNRLAIVVPPITDVTITTVTIPGLDAKTKYTFVVKATDGVYESIASKIKVATKAV